MRTIRSGSSKKVAVTLWVVQVLLAALFLFAGTMKFVMPMSEMTKQTPLPGSVLYFIGVAEVAGALGLILPSLLRIRPHLTSVAAGGLVLIMTGASALTLQAGLAAAIPTVVIGILAGFVAYGRSQLAPIAATPRRRPAPATSVFSQRARATSLLPKAS